MDNFFFEASFLDYEFVVIVDRVQKIRGVFQAKALLSALLFFPLKLEIKQISERGSAKVKTQFSYQRKHSYFG